MTGLTDQMDSSKPVGMSVGNREYLKRAEARKLRGFQEYKTAKFSYGASFILFAVIFIIGLCSGVNVPMIAFSMLYLFSGIYQLVLSSIVRKQILNDGRIKRSTRYFGLVLIPFIATGNVFASIAGFTLIKEEKSIEYTLSIYMVLVSVGVMLVSAINLFKEYIYKYFMLGMALLGAATVFYLIVMVLISKYVHGKKVDKKMMPVAVLLICCTATGNLFALALGIVLISKIKHKDDDVSIEWIDILGRLFRNNMSVIGIFVVAFLLSLSICSYMTFDYDIAVENNYSALLRSPSLEYPFGTDNYGRCAFTRIVFGARISLVIGVIATIFPMVIGGILGSVSGFYGNKIDNVIMRILDILYAVPSILLAIAIVAAFGASTVNLILAISVSSIPVFARLVRAQVMTVSSSEYVEAARACGAGDIIIIFKHIIPNSLAPVIVRATMSIGTAVLSTSSLSYLGLGVEPHIPEWGNVLKIGSSYLETNPYLAIFPGLAIMLIVLAFNFFGDGLRDAIDPKLK